MRGCATAAHVLLVLPLHRVLQISQLHAVWCLAAGFQAEPSWCVPLGSALAVLGTVWNAAGATPWRYFNASCSTSCFESSPHQFGPSVVNLGLLQTALF